MLREDILEVLLHHSEGIKARDIADILGIDKSLINSCLYSNQEIFERDDEYRWYAREDSDDDGKYDDPVLQKLNNVENAEYFSLDEFNSLADWGVCLSPGDVPTKYYHVTRTGNIINCDSKSELAMWEYLKEKELIVAGGGQKLRIPYETSFRSDLSYYPDMVVLTKLNHIAIIEVKAATAMDNHSNMEKYAGLEEYCYEHGYEFMMIDPINGFITYDELRDMRVVEGLCELFEVHDEDSCFHFDKEDVAEWYEELGDGLTKKDFELMVHSCVIYFNWFNKFKNGFEVTNRPIS